MLLADGVEVILSTPTPYDEYSDSDEVALHGGYALMQGYAEYVRALADEKQVALYDAHAKLSRIIAEDSIISSDHIHPTVHGYYVLAEAFLSEQGIDAGDEGELPAYFGKWHSYVARLRKVLASECMLVRSLGISFDTPTDKKMAVMSKKVADEDFGRAVFESFYRAYVVDKPHEAELYLLIDDAYENDIANSK